MLASSTEIIALIISGFSGLATIAAFLSCYFTYLATKPKIKLIIYKSYGKELTLFSFDSNNKCFAVIGVEIINQSAINGTISDLYAIINNDSYCAESIFDENVLATKITRINAGTGAKSDSDLIRLKLPLSINAYSSINGYFVLPCLPINSQKDISIFLEYIVVGRRRKKRKITLTYQSPLE